MFEERRLVQSDQETESEVNILDVPFSHLLLHPESSTDGPIQQEHVSAITELHDAATDVGLYEYLHIIGKVLLEARRSNSEDESTQPPAFTLSRYERHAHPELTVGVLMKWPELQPKVNPQAGTEDFIQAEVFCFAQYPAHKYIRISVSRQPVVHPDIIISLDDEDDVRSVLEQALLTLTQQMGLRHIK
jgi:hypothetical protein